MEYRKGEMRKVAAWVTLFIFSMFLFSNVSASPFIVGVVNNSLDGENANGYEITLWKESVGLSDNLTDIIGPGGNSGANNIYFIDCGLLNNGCSVGDQINVQVLNNGSDYVTERASLIVSGAGFDVMPDLRLNTKPNTSLADPVDYFNFSISTAELACDVNDLDGNLENVTLYGDWAGGWHANQTQSVSGISGLGNFSVTLADGDYEWGCYVSDNLSISDFSDTNRTFTIDTTPPSITDISLNATGNICGLTEQVRVNCTTTDAGSGIESVLIQTLNGGAEANYSASLLLGDVYFADIPVNETGDWEFTCWAEDHAGNLASLDASNNITVLSLDADITLESQHISFLPISPIEGESVIVNTTIFNDGCSDSGEFLVGFFENDTLQIEDNQTITVPAFSNNSTFVNWNAKIGETEIFVYSDIADNVTETDEGNNEANTSIVIGAWQEFYGNISGDRLLGDASVNNFSLWFNETSFNGSLFVIDADSNINWIALEALGRNTSGGATGNDFTEVDSLLGMTGFADSVSSEFTQDGNTPNQTDSFLVYNRIISDVPVINSTNNDNFITGILWDSGDDTNAEYDSTEQEDLVFVTKLNQGQAGAYGIYDYEINIPVRLREYLTADLTDIAIYFELT